MIIINGLRVHDTIHKELLLPHEHKHINRNTKYTIRCSCCKRETFYHRMCPTITEIMLQDELYKLAETQTYAYRHICGYCNKQSLYVIKNW